MKLNLNKYKNIFLKLQDIKFNFAIFLIPIFLLLVDPIKVQPFTFYTPKEKEEYHLLFLSGEEKFINGDVEGAIFDLEKSEKIFNQHIQARMLYEILSTAHYNQGNYKKAREFATKGLKYCVNEKCIMLYSIRGKVYEKLNKNRACSDYKKAYTLGIGNYFSNMGWSKSSIDNYYTKNCV